MIESIKALFRGYIKFRVVTAGGERFYWSYSKAQAARMAVKTGVVYFDGFHVVKGWISFFQRIEVK